MSPESFWQLHYSELCLILEGYAERKRKEREAARWGRAWLGTVIAMSAGAKDVTPAKLLGEKEPKGAVGSKWVKASPVSAEEAVQHLLKAKRRGKRGKK